MKTTAPAFSNDVDFFPGISLRWGLGYMINMTPGPDGRSAGSLTWGGLFNSYYWIDPTRRVAAVISDFYHVTEYLGQLAKARHPGQEAAAEAWRQEWCQRLKAEGGGPVPPGSSTVVVHLEPDGDGTLVRLNHRGLPDAEMRELHREGWERFLSRLAAAATVR